MVTKIRPVMHNVVHGYAFCIVWSIMCFYKKYFSPTDVPKKPEEDKQNSRGGESLPLFHVILPQKQPVFALRGISFFKHSVVSFLKVVEPSMTGTCLLWVKGITNRKEVRCRHHVFLFFYNKAQTLWSNAELSRPSWGNAYKININFRD